MDRSVPSSAHNTGNFALRCPHSDRGIGQESLQESPRTAIARVKYRQRQRSGAAYAAFGRRRLVICAATTPPPPQASLPPWWRRSAALGISAGGCWARAEQRTRTEKANRRPEQGAAAGLDGWLRCRRANTLPKANGWFRVGGGGESSLPRKDAKPKTEKADPVRRHCRLGW